MSITADIVDAIKRELRTANMTYAQLGERLGLSAQGVKKMFASGDMSLSRLEAICSVLRLNLEDLFDALTNGLPRIAVLTEEQERAVIADKKLLIVSICVLSHWTVEQITVAYRLSEPEVIAALVQLDRLGVITLRPGNTYALRLSKAFRWRANGPVMQYFRENVVLDYYSGSFDKDSEGLHLVHGTVSHASAVRFKERLERLAYEFASQHAIDRKLPQGELEGFTLLVSLRNWEHELFRNFRR